MKRIVRFVLIRDIVIFLAGTWYFEYYLDYTFPEENNLLIYFVAIPIIWATLTQLWTSYGYREVSGVLLHVATHILSSLIMLSTVFLISAVLNTISTTLDSTGVIMFHVVGWTVVTGMIVYDCVDAGRR